MSYAKALAKLESLPADEQELASGRYVFEVRDGRPHCGCAIGKLLTEEQRAELVKCAANEGSISELSYWMGFDFDRIMLDGLRYHEADALQIVNDKAAGKYDNAPAARRERYRLVIAWLREQVAKEAK